MKNKIQKRTVFEITAFFLPLILLFVGLQIWPILAVFGAVLVPWMYVFARVLGWTTYGLPVAYVATYLTVYALLRIAIWWVMRRREAIREAYLAEKLKMRS